MMLHVIWELDLLQVVSLVHAAQGLASVEQRAAVSVGEVAGQVEDDLRGHLSHVSHGQGPIQAVAGVAQHGQAHLVHKEAAQLVQPLVPEVVRRLRRGALDVLVRLVVGHIFLPIVGKDVFGELSCKRQNRISSHDIENDLYCTDY